MRTARVQTSCLCLRESAPISTRHENALGPPLVASASLTARSTESLTLDNAAGRAVVPAYALPRPQRRPTSEGRSRRLRPDPSADLVPEVRNAITPHCERHQSSQRGGNSGGVTTSIRPKPHSARQSFSSGTERRTSLSQETGQSTFRFSRGG